MCKKMKKACAFILASIMCMQPIYAYAQVQKMDEATIEALPQTAVTRAESETINCEVTGDAYVWDRTTNGENKKNYGSATGLEIKTTAGPNYTREGYYIIDLANIEEPYINSAKLNIHVESIRGTVSHKAEEVLTIYETTAFDEMAVTWDNKPAAVKKVGQAIVDRSKAGEYFSIDLTDYINEELAKGEQLGEKYFIIKIDKEHMNDNSGLLLSSKESANGPTFEVQKGLPAPTVEVEGIQDKVEVTEETLTFNVSASSVNENISLTTQVLLNGAPVNGEDGTYTVNLVSGKNHIQIIVTDPDGNKVEKNYRVTRIDDAFIQSFEIIRKQWSDQITMNNLYGTNNEDYLASMEQVTAQANELWESMNKYDPASGADTRQELWSKYTSDKESSHITYTFQNLRKMAMAYSAKGSELYQNEELLKDILSGLDWMYANRYHENIGRIYDNWWDFNIGGAQALCDTLVMLYDQLSEEQLNNQITALDHFNADPFVSIGIYDNVIKMEAANLLDKLLVKALTGIVANSNSHLELVSEATCTVFPYVTKGNGFYEDGSYIDHSTVPYAGGYGGVLMSGISKLLFVTDGSPWEITDPQLDNVYDWIINSFEPLYYKGAIMDMVSGRGITRYSSSDHSKGKGLLHKMLELAQTAPEPKKTQILSFIKENILEDTMCEDYFTGMNTNDTIRVKALLEDESIPARGDLVLHKVYGAMDRTVHHRPGFSLGISMFSERISAYEVGNGENLKPWHTADGMMYLYNDDHEQFTKDFWPTVDPMRLPGITTDHSTRKMADWYDYLSTKSWVGGSSIHDLYGATGMEFEMEPGKSDLTGKKSWFMFDDEIVALGAGINATGDHLVETIVENRKIKDSGDNTILIDGQEMQETFGESKVDLANWAFLSGNTEAGTDTLGYYFPEGTPLTVRREARTGSWKDINSGGPADPITKNYVSFAIEHTNNPVDEGYSYVMLPNKSSQEVEAYSQKSDISILVNTKDVQAVRENKLGIVGMNFWNPSTVEYVTAKNPCSVMIDENGKTLSLGISDPTHLANEVVIILDKEQYEVKSKDDTVSVRETEEGLEITVQTAKSLGKTHQLELVSTVPSTAPSIAIDAPIEVETGSDFTVTLGVSNSDQLVYAQDLILNYDETLFNLEEIEGLNNTEVITAMQGAGVWRILAATEGGAVDGLETIALNFKAKDIPTTKSGNISMTKGEIGLVTDGTSTKETLEPSSQDITVKVPVIEKDEEDVNQDDVIDIADLALIAYYYQAKVGEDNWEQAKRADVDGNGVVNVSDLSIVANKILGKDK